MTIADEIAAGFVTAFDYYCAHDVATTLNCGEVNALAELLAAMDEPDLAATWIDAHADGDDEGDMHYRERT
ncbi:hypothetical protein ACU635_50705 [[Actinomadura] parvosata]|uniref:hypothetical protein n=1 Tax=[Actinomadura] parvosata TaxID=1955412 RepID=UPI00406CDB6F